MKSMPRNVRCDKKAADSLFGIWKDNLAVQKVDGFVRDLRRSRIRPADPGRVQDKVLES